MSDEERLGIKNLVQASDGNLSRVAAEGSESSEEEESSNEIVVVEEGLVRTLSLWDGIAIVIGIEIGSGIFASPGPVMENSGNVTLLALGVWVLGGLIAILGGLCMSELSAAWPTSGGPYVYFQLLRPIRPLRCLGVRGEYPVGEALAFTYAWASLLIIKSGSQAIIAIVFGRYVGIAIGILDMGDENVDSHMSLKLIAAGLVVFLTVVNIIGTRAAALISRVSTVCKFVGILYLLAVGLLHFALTDQSTLGDNLVPEWSELARPTVWLSALGAGVVAALWSYDGWADLTSVAEEIKRPDRNMSRSILGGTVFVIGAYLLANLAYASMIPSKHLSEDPVPALSASRDAIEALFGEVAGRVAMSVMAAFIAVSALGAANGSVMSGGRVVFALARDDLAFPLSRVLAHVGAWTRTPDAALLAQSVWAVAMIFPGNFDSLVNLFGVSSYIFYALTVAVLIVLRWTHPDVERPFRVRPFPVIPLIFLAASAVLVGFSFYSSPIGSTIATIVAFSGLPLHALWFWKRGPLRRLVVFLCLSIIRFVRSKIRR